MKKEAVNWAGELAIIHTTGKETDGKYCLVELYATQEGEPGLHVHEREDEGFYIIDGEFTITIGDKTHNCKSGDYVFAPKNIPHKYQVKSDGYARLLITTSPAGFEEYVRATSTPASSVVPPPPGSGSESEDKKMKKLAGQYGIKFL